MDIKQALEELIDELKWCCNDGKTLTPYDEKRINVIKQHVEKQEKKIKLYEAYMMKWEEQLGISGVNSKGMVRADIQYLLSNKDK